MHILLIGSGGREHALVLKIAASPLCTRLVVAPGNPGIAECATLLPLKVEAIDDLVLYAKNNAIDLVVVGPEVPLTLGIADRMHSAGISCFGPTQAAARLEGSKGFMKDLVARAGVPTAFYGRFTDMDQAIDFIERHGAPIVIKTDGLAAGKGVTIATTTDEAIATARAMLSGDAFGDAGREIIIEEFLHGFEISFFALCDGVRAIPFGSATDHKRAFDGDQGPNTGGMGAVSPARGMTPDLEETIMQTIIQPTLDEMNRMGCPFTGVLFAGLMIKDNVPTLLEFNIRFGDPECQTLMARLQSDLVPILHHCATGSLDTLPPVHWSDDTAISVVMAARGYPGPIQNNTRITDIKRAAQHDPSVHILQAGTGLDPAGNLIATGGRVLNVVASGTDVSEARDKAYKTLAAIDWPHGFYRTDIGIT